MRGVELLDGLSVTGRADQPDPEPADELQAHFRGPVEGLVEFDGEAAAGDGSFFHALGEVFLPGFNLQRKMERSPEAAK